jgi:hypothetical protein
MSQTRSVEWLLASMMVAWGFGLLLPGDTMSLPQHRMLGALAPEFVWAAWSISIGAVRVLALYINGSWRRTPLFRVAGRQPGIDLVDRARLPVLYRDRKRSGAGRADVVSGLHRV